MQHIGIFGGTFNPVHTGHLLAADAVYNQLGLSEIRFLPAAQSPFKEKPNLGDKHRIKMLEYAITDYPAFKIDSRELNAAAPSYTINTLRSLADDLPGDRLYLLIGMDAWQNFEDWYHWREIVEYCHLVVMTRPGYAPAILSSYWQAKRVTDAETLRASGAGSLMFVSVPASTAASSEIRNRIQQNKNTRGQLPDSVKDYIIKQRLYL